MAQLEPNLAGLAWFGLLWSVCCIGFLQLAGMYPLRRRAILPVTMTTALWAMLLAGTLAFASAELRWTTVVVVGGVLFLFLPGLFQLDAGGHPLGGQWTFDADNRLKYPKNRPAANSHCCKRR